MLPQSPRLAIVVGTYNRLGRLRGLLDSVARQTRTPFKIYVTDAGSTDGTVEYLRELGRNDARVVPVLTGKKIGQARSLNEVFATIDAEYTCWLSDDNEVVNGGLDTGVQILDAQPDIGMVGLKVKDVCGPWTASPYVGGISALGILNVNQGMLRTSLLQALGGFCDEFPDYGIDPDLTARVLFAGWDIVYTKQVAVDHYREWYDDENSPRVKERLKRNERAWALYERKFGHLDSKAGRWLLKCKIGLHRLHRLLTGSLLATPGHNWRDWHNVFHCRYISLFDMIQHRHKPHHLLQRGQALGRGGRLGAAGNKEKSHDQAFENRAACNQ